MTLSPIGKTARIELLKTPEIRDNVVIDEWVIMPNHIHVIFRILPASYAVETHRGASLHPANHHPANQQPVNQQPVNHQPANQQPVNQQPNRQKNRFGPQSDNLPAVVRGFKSAVKQRTNIKGIEFHWQARYHDHIIRNRAELERIRYYIRQNVFMW